MSLFDRVRESFRPLPDEDELTETAALKAQTAALMAELAAVKTLIDRPLPSFMLDDAQHARYDVPDGSLPWNQADLYQKLSWVQIAVAAVAQQVAVVPFSVKRRAGEKLVNIPNHPFELLLARPNPLQSRFEFLVALASYYALNGNAYIWLNRPTPGAPPVELWVIPTYKIRPLPDGNLYLAGYEYDTGAGYITLPVEDVVHIKRFHPLNSWVGLSPIGALATAAEGDLKAQSYNLAFYGQDNAKVPGALVFSDFVNETDWQRMGEDIKAQHGGVRRSLMRLRGAGQGGVQWVQMGLSQADMQYLEGRSHTRAEIYATFAPGLDSTLSVNATEANSQAGKASFIEFAIWPLLVAIGEKLTNDVLPLYDQRSRHALVGQFDDIRPTDRRLALLEQQAAERVMTVDEIRERYYGLGPLSEGGAAGRVAT